MNELSWSRFHHLPDIDSPVHHLRSYIEEKDGATYSDDCNYGFHLLLARISTQRKSCQMVALGRNGNKQEKYFGRVWVQIGNYVSVAPDPCSNALTLSD